MIPLDLLREARRKATSGEWCIEPLPEKYPEFQPEEVRTADGALIADCFVRDNNSDRDNAAFIALSANEWEKMCDTMETLMKAVEYYAPKDHYKEFYTMTGIRPPGVLAEGGAKARAALERVKEIWKT